MVTDRARDVRNIFETDISIIDVIGLRNYAANIELENLIFSSLTGFSIAFTSYGIWERCLDLNNWKHILG